MAEVSDIRSSRGSRRRRIYLDGSEWGSIPAEVVRDIGLRTGQHVDPDDLERRAAASAETQAWERALRLLDFRERGSEELRRRLIEDAYPPDLASRVVDRALELGFVDDRRFAESLVRGATEGKGHGRRRVAAALAAKGVDDVLAADVLSSACDEESEYERALALAQRLSTRVPDAPRLARRLASRGFSPALAWRVAKQVAGRLDTSPDEA